MDSQLKFVRNTYTWVPKDFKVQIPGFGPKVWHIIIGKTGLRLFMLPLGEV